MFLQAEDAVLSAMKTMKKLKRSRLVDGDVGLTITGEKLANLLLFLQAFTR